MGGLFIWGLMGGEKEMFQIFQDLAAERKYAHTKPKPPKF